MPLPIRTPPSPKLQRSKLLAQIHIAKGQLGMDDDTYRSMLVVTTGKQSAAGMTIVELRQVVSALKAKGFRPVSKHTGNRKMASDPQSRKMRSLWIQLHEAGRINDASERALATWVKNQTGVSALQFLHPQQKWHLIERLKQWLAR